MTFVAGEGGVLDHLGKSGISGPSQTASIIVRLIYILFALTLRVYLSPDRIGLSRGPNGREASAQRGRNDPGEGSELTREVTVEGANRERKQRENSKWELLGSCGFNGSDSRNETSRRFGAERKNC